MTRQQIGILFCSCVSAADDRVTAYQTDLMRVRTKSLASKHGFEKTLIVNQNELVASTHDIAQSIGNIE